jgi:hypothetical protein
MPAAQKNFPLIAPPRRINQTTMTQPPANPICQFGTMMGGIETQKKGLPLTISDPNQPSIIGWPGSSNLYTPGSFVLPAARPFNNVANSVFTAMWEPNAYLYRVGFPVASPKSLFISDGLVAGVAGAPTTALPVLSAISSLLSSSLAGLNILAMPDFLGVGEQIITGGGGTWHTTSPLLLPFPVADQTSDVIDYNGPGGAFSLSDFTLDGGSLMGGQVLYIHFCGIAGPYTTLIPGTLGSGSFDAAINPYSGPYSPTYIQDAPNGGIVGAGASGLIWNVMAAAEMAAVQAVIGSMASFKLVIVCGNGSDANPFYGHSGTGPTIITGYPSSWNAIFNTLTAPWIESRFENYSDPSMPSRVISQETAAFFT